MVISNLRKLLKEKGLTQTELSRVSGVRMVSISHMCNGKNPHLSVETANKLCAVLSCDIGDIWQYVPDADNNM